jgi:acetylornithine deacetylase/succinyl-diaminopimelate desuccinylase-like protein
LLDFLRIPSVSALPDHADDVQRAARWVADRLQSAGVEGVRVLPTGGHPVVYGEWLHAPGKPTILIYGHFDTQPADPLGLWTNPPFEPTVRDGRVYARGASDDKGNMLIPILAVEAMLQADGSLPLNVKFFFEGQEEIGSPQLPAFVAAQRELLACVLVVSADGSQWAEDQPAILVGLRGTCAIQIDVYGARSDLHSGLYGGMVANPIHALVSVLGSMRDAAGRILVDGFYDRVANLSADERAAIAAVPFDEEQYKEQLGVSALVGEPGYSPRERNWVRPTLEINGIWGGFQGEGVKTVLPNEAHAKITCRLVPDQTPEQIVQALVSHIERQATPGVRVEVRRMPTRAAPYLVPADHWGNRAAADVLAELYGTQPYATRSGGAVPVCELFQGNLGVHTVTFGFGLEDEQIHAPDEFFRLSSFERGPVAYCKLLTRLGQQQ